MMQPFIFVMRACSAQSAPCHFCVLVPDTIPVFLRYDDYDYGEINQLLDRSFKIYIKTMVCSPEKTTKRMYESFWRQFQHSEKVKFNPEYPIPDSWLQLFQ